ncbi:glutathione-regulated potassium-efflux system ancillary protein KefC/glutathione-regulated potassium-efflux system protein KefB [Chitinivorax tropicus]|uniref:Glutathione-regulated potassium-efflux system ancillary protein KefC/glutathione-regulated potassium-efflux system protein KefB n=1 Tax=Chitinivorax tropicus TaxID=714531 RepID=A0A840MK49_9PROT|nr:glutathione-regulated potassium-efflux system ancillary protein KefC/glutathione-regulated potassium-efflux system protein KefB [Chitinivorax tropicus]
MAYLSQTILFLAVAVTIVPLFRKLGLGAVLGYLIAGVVIGPWGLKLIDNVEQVLHVSELGVILLLFVIGLELEPSRLWVLRRPVFGLGGAQVILSGLVLGGFAIWQGLTWKSALIVGLGLAMSSTAFVLQTLAERQELTARHGRDAFSILLFQDIAVIPLLALIPLLSPVRSGEGGLDWGDAARAIGTVLGVIGAGHYLLRPAFRYVARSGAKELFTAAALLVVIGNAVLLQWAGLSMSLGAFLAGVMLADSEYRHELEANIDPFKGLLLGLFFIAVGMTANLGIMLAHPLKVLALTLGLIAAKTLVLLILARITGADRATAVKLGITLSQGGEFAFVLFSVATTEKIISTALNDTLVVAVTLSMLIAPFLFIAYDKLIAPWLERTTEREFDQIEDHDKPVIIAGFGRFGQIVARILHMQHIPFTALDKSTQQVDFVRKFGNQIYYGDASRLELLEAAGTGKARLFVLALDDVDTSIKTAELMRRHFPHVPVYARARNRYHAYKLMDAGAKAIYRETFGSSLDMAQAVLGEMGLDEQKARQSVDTFEQADLDLLRRQHAVYQDEHLLMQSAQQAQEELKHLFESEQHKAET